MRILNMYMYMYFIDFNTNNTHIWCVALQAADWKQTILSIYKNQLNAKYKFIRNLENELNRDLSNFFFIEKLYSNQIFYLNMIWNGICKKITRCRWDDPWCFFTTEFQRF